MDTPADPRRMSGVRLLALVGMVMLAAGCGSVTPTPTLPAIESPPLRSPSPSAPMLKPPATSPAPAALVGTWSGSPAEERTDRVTITFAACRDGEVCGSGTWTHDSSPRDCDFTLAHTAADEVAFVFTVKSDGLRCAWGGPANGTTFRVDYAPNDALGLWHSGGNPHVTLSRSEGPGS